MPPISLIFSIVGLFKDEKKGVAIAGVVISGLAFLILLLPTVCDWQVMW